MAMNCWLDMLHIPDEWFYVPAFNKQRLPLGLQELMRLSCACRGLAQRQLLEVTPDWYQQLHDDARVKIHIIPCANQLGPVLMGNAVFCRLDRLHTMYVRWHLGNCTSRLLPFHTCIERVAEGARR